MEWLDREENTQTRVRPLTDKGVGISNVLEAVVVILVEMLEKWTANHWICLICSALCAVVAEKDHKGVIKLSLLLQLVQYLADVDIHGLGKVS